MQELDTESIEGKGEMMADDMGIEKELTESRDKLDKIKAILE